MVRASPRIRSLRRLAAGSGAALLVLLALTPVPAQAQDEPAPKTVLYDITADTPAPGAAYAWADPAGVYFRFTTPAIVLGDPVVVISSKPGVDGNGVLLRRWSTSVLQRYTGAYSCSVCVPDVFPDEQQPEEAQNRIHWHATADQHDFGRHQYWPGDDLPPEDIPAPPDGTYYWQAMWIIPGVIHLTHPQPLRYGGYLPAITLAQARAWVGKAIRRYVRGTPRALRSTCKRLDAASATCFSSWADETYAYAGDLVVRDVSPTQVTTSFKGLRARRTCVRRRGAKACARPFRFGAA